MVLDYLPLFPGLSEDGNRTGSGGIDVRIAHAVICIGFADVGPVTAISFSPSSNDSVESVFT